MSKSDSTARAVRGWPVEASANRRRVERRGGDQQRRVLDSDVFLVVQDIYETETTRYADVVLPAAGWGEKAGTFTNVDRTVHLSEQAVEPPGQARSDLDIFLDYARRMDFRDAAGARLIRWTSPEEVFRAWQECSRAAYLPPHEEPDADYPFLYSTGRTVYQFHTRTKTRRARQLDRAAPDAWVEMSVADADRLGIAEGDVVRVTSRRGEIVVPARVAGGRTGTVFAPFHYGSVDGDGRAANELTMTEWDPVSKQPVFKVAAVRIERVRAGDGPAPAPTTAASRPAGPARVPATVGGPDAGAAEDIAPVQPPGQEIQGATL